jgi:hypothetical protein
MIELKDDFKWRRCVMCCTNIAQENSAFCSDACFEHWKDDTAVPFDTVNRPPHYASGTIECIDAMRAALGDEAVEHFCIANAFKYIFRHRKKNGQEDLRKAIWYLRMATGDDPRIEQ